MSAAEERISDGCFVGTLPNGFRVIDPELVVKRFDEHVQGMCGRLWSMKRFRHEGFRGARWESEGYPVSFELNSKTRLVIFVEGLGWCIPESVVLSFEGFEAAALDALEFVEEGKPGGINGFIESKYERAKTRRAFKEARR